MKMPGATFEYKDDAEKTAKSRLRGFFTVGDIGYIDTDGYLFLNDRANDMIIVGGVNIYPAEVEGTLVQHPAVGDVAVLRCAQSRHRRRDQSRGGTTPGMVTG